MRTIKSYQEQLLQNVEKLITTAELQYNALSSVTFTFAGKYTNVLGIKSRHDKLSYMAYGNARKLNKLFGVKTDAIIIKICKTSNNSRKDGSSYSERL